MQARPQGQPPDQGIAAGVMQGYIQAAELFQRIVNGQHHARGGGISGRQFQQRPPQPGIALVAEFDEGPAAARNVFRRRQAIARLPVGIPIFKGRRAVAGGVEIHHPVAAFRGRARIRGQRGCLVEQNCADQSDK